MLNMKIEVNTYEIWDLLKEGSTNQKDFIEKLYYEEFKEFIELWKEEYNNYLDLRSCLNGGCLAVEDISEDVEKEYIIYNNGRVCITLY